MSTRFERLARRKESTRTARRRRRFKCGTASKKGECTTCKPEAKTESKTPKEKKPELVEKESKLEKIAQKALSGDSKPSYVGPYLPEKKYASPPPAYAPSKPAYNAADEYKKRGGPRCTTGMCNLS